MTSPTVYGRIASPPVLLVAERFRRSIATRRTLRFGSITERPRGAIVPSSSSARSPTPMMEDDDREDDDREDLEVVPSNFRFLG